MNRTQCGILPKIEFAKAQRDRLADRLRDVETPTDEDRELLESFVPRLMNPVDRS
jgi:hypothetical protein